MRWCLPIVSLSVLMTGCAPILDIFFPPDDGPGTVIETGSPELKAFESEAELRDYLLGEINGRNGNIENRMFGMRGGMDLVDESGDFDMLLGSDSMMGPDSIAAAPPMAAPGGNADAGGGSAVQDASASGDDGASFSDTTTQEAGVDEADVVKTDGDYLYVIDDGKLRIIRITPPESLGVVAEIVLTGYGRDIYLHNGKVIALTTDGGGFFIAEGGVGIDIAVSDAVEVSNPSDDVEVSNSSDEDGAVIGSDGSTGTDVSVSSDVTTDVDVDISTSTIFAPDTQDYFYHRPRTIVTVVDATSVDNISILSETKFDGTVSSSRMIDGKLHLVLANYQDYYFDVMPMLGRPELDVSAVEVSMLMPRFEKTNGDGTKEEGAAVSWRSLYRPTDPDGFGIVTVVSLNVDDAASFKSVGIVAEPGLIYSSLQALYLTDTNYDFSGNSRETTDIYKLTYKDDGNAIPTSVGTVPGRILNQYSMGEHEGHLRVATTVGPTFFDMRGRTEPYNNVYVMAEADGKLDVVGSIENIAPGETIQSARFMGDRGYLVTFVQIDPLFTLDLSVPTDPKVVGELKVPGFSTYMVPLDESHLLAVGQHVPEVGFFNPQAVQLSIFDVSNFAEPTLRHNVIIGEGMGSYSEAVHNPKAFTYFAESELVALPVNIENGFGFFEPFIDEDVDDVGFTTDGEAADAPPIDPDEPAVGDSPGIAPPAERFTGLIVYRVSAAEGFTEVGRISTSFANQGRYWSSFTRGVFINENVFGVTSLGLRGGAVDNLSETPYELFWADPLPDLGTMMIGPIAAPMPDVGMPGMTMR